MFRRVLTGAFLLFALAAPVAAADPPLRLLVPAYFYPSRAGKIAWDRLLAAGAKVPVVAVANPDSGPGKKADPIYRDLIRQAAQAKTTIAGYATLSYGRRPVSAVRADVDSWLFFYPEVGGMFLDEQPAGPEGVGFAADGLGYAREKFPAGVVVSNPGMVCERDYGALRSRPTVCLWERGTGPAAYAPPKWAADVSPDQMAVLLYGGRGADAMRDAVKAAVAKRAGFVYVTDAAGDNPWDRLPTYWDDLVAAVAAVNAARK